MYSSVFFLLVLLCGACAHEKPNVLFVVVDDLGWNDVGFHGSDIPTPYIDSLANAGVILDNYYVQPLCSPSRTAFMTGRYPYHLGTADYVITNGFNMSIPLDETTIAEKFKENGYSTHIVGKWDCGMTYWSETPTFRGFDSFYGFYGAQEDHYTRVVASGLYTGVDFRNNTTADNSTNGVYSTELYTKRIVDIINAKANDGVPLYLHVAYQAVHTPLEVPAQYLAKCANITDTNRRTLCGMAQTVEQGLKNITTALANHNLLNNTLIVFTTDNGGDPSSGSNNFPLRGCKGDVWEAGVRGAAWVWGSMLESGGRKLKNLMHITDWLPTLMDAIGGNHRTNKPLDGFSQWHALKRPDVPPARHELLVQLIPAGPGIPVEQAAYRYGKWKLIHGQASLLAYCLPGYWYPLPPACPIASPPPPADLTWLFDVSVDPYEVYNVAAEYPDVVNFLSQRLQFYRDQNVTQQPHVFDPASNPARFGGFWTPWALNTSVFAAGAASSEI